MDTFYPSGRGKNPFVVKNVFDYQEEYAGIKWNALKELNISQWELRGYTPLTIIYYLFI